MIEFGFVGEKREIWEGFKGKFIKRFKYLREMSKSGLEIGRGGYEGKVGKGVRGSVKGVGGGGREWVGDEEEMKKLFGNSYGMGLIKFENRDERVDLGAMNVGVIVWGGEGGGGENVIWGIFEGIKKLKKDRKV